MEPCDSNGQNGNNINSLSTILDRIPIFGGLTRDQQMILMSKLEEVKYPPNSLIFEEGDKPSNIYIVYSGKIRLVKELYTEPLELIEFCIGQCFGESALLSIEPHSASAVTIEKSTLFILKNSSLYEFYRSDKELYIILLMNMAREVSRRLNRTEDFLLRYYHFREKK